MTLKIVVVSREQCLELEHVFALILSKAAVLKQRQKQAALNNRDGLFHHIAAHLSVTDNHLLHYRLLHNGNFPLCQTI